MSRVFSDSSFFAAAYEARFPSTISRHRPIRLKIWEGMCSACGTDGAIPA